MADELWRGVRGVWVWGVGAGKEGMTDAVDYAFEGEGELDGAAVARRCWVRHGLIFACKIL